VEAQYHLPCFSLLILKSPEDNFSCRGPFFLFIFCFYSCYNVLGLMTKVKTLNLELMYGTDMEAVVL